MSEYTLKTAKIKDKSKKNMKKVKKNKGRSNDVGIY